jgi:hypothetical protein
MKGRLFLILCLFLTMNCQKNERNPPFIIDLSFKCDADETIKLYYLTDNINTYSEEFSQVINIKGKSHLQNISFKLDNIPSRFRIDLGENGNTNEIFIQKISLHKNNDTIIIQHNEMHRFFKPNIYIDMKKGQIIRKKIESRYDPFIQSQPLLHQIIKLTFWPKQ